MIDLVEGASEHVLQLPIVAVAIGDWRAGIISNAELVVNLQHTH
jgi:hypothetical protein